MSRKQFTAFFWLTWFSFRAQTRNKATFAFGFLFPVVFITIFGIIGTVDQKENLEKSLTQGKISGIISEEKTSAGQPSIKLLTSSASPQDADRIRSFVRGVIDQSNLRIAGVTTPSITLDEKEISGRQYRYIDFALPGQLGFSLLGIALFGTVFGLIYLKKALVLKRMLATPVNPLIILLAQGTSRLIIVLIQATLILSVGVILFNFYLYQGFFTFLQLLILAAFSLVAFLGFGYFMSGFAHDENSATPMVQLITLPQLLLSGTFFSTDNLPTWIQPIANNLRLSYFNIAARKITTEGATLIDVWPYILALAIWGGVMYILAAKTFRWEP